MQNKQQEFLKQREKLKYVTQNTVVKNALDPDIMIEQLISDKETFKFNVESLPYALPKWLKVENNPVPAVYEQVWQAVKLGPTFQYCDTIVITSLFTTSGLSLETLGYLWSLTNVSSPGFLTRQELYIMLALIALVQTGYQVHDIGILNSINHPVLPQLDYSILKITVANPAIDRRNNHVKSTHSVHSDFNAALPSNSVPLLVKPNFNVAAEQRKVAFDAYLKHSNISNLVDANSLVNGLEPRSLDLHVSKEPAPPLDEDEFTEFQSATIPIIDEYSDFQSASPVVKYELLDSAAGKLPQPINSTVENKIHSSVHEKLPPRDSNGSSLPKIGPKKLDFLKDELLDDKKSTETNKYDVFRALMEPSEEIKSQRSDDCYEDNENEEEDDEFGDFYAADVIQNEVKRELSIKDKCLEACLRLLREGLRIFSSISNERITMEVLTNERGCSYFYQLKIVYDTSQRFQTQFESTHLNDSIQSTWAKLSKFTKYISNENLLDDMPSEDDVDATPCKLCETKCDVNCARYAGHNYHVTCINLFLHFVEDSEITTMLNI